MRPYDIKKQAGGNPPGVGTMGYIAALSWFDTIASPGPDTGIPGETCHITTSHTFLDLPIPSPPPSPMPSPLPKYGFIEFYTTMGTAKANIKSIGSPDNWGIENTYEAHVPGDQLAWFENMYLNEPMIFLIPHPDCSVATYLQYGTKCDPCLFDGIEWASGTKGGTDKRGFTVKLKAYGAKPLIYSATVPRVGSYT